MKGYKTKPAKGTGAWGKAWRKPGRSFPESSPSGVAQGAPNSSHGTVWQYLQSVSAREVHWPHRRAFYWRLATYRPSAKHVSKFQTPRRKRVFSMNILFAQSRHSELSLSLGNVGKTPEIQVPRR